MYSNDFIRIRSYSYSYTLTLTKFCRKGNVLPLGKLSKLWTKPHETLWFSSINCTEYNEVKFIIWIWSMRVTFNRNSFTNNFYNEKPKENALLMDTRKVSRTVAIRIHCLSCPFRSPQQWWDDSNAETYMSECDALPRPVSLGLMEPWAISNSSTHSPRGFPSTLPPNILPFASFCF